ncbi:endonuclease domain-containing protein [Spirosoma soli]|uniref:Endonuclease domain-containing protein n=1 Tax=Spirosoma soli TaxID=1770529 RepID=A0ABW5MBJ5_9BACT
MARGGSSTPSIKELRRELRQNQTNPEIVLWEKIRNRQLDGKKFRRQHSFGRFIVDFYCHEYLLVIEVDGSVHNTLEARIDDAERELILQDLGLRILRFSNDDVMHHIDKVLSMISENLI